MTELDGRVVVVTGGASGIGRALVQRFSARGAIVVVADLDLAAAEAVAGAITAHPGGRAFAMAVDVADPASVEHLRDEVIRQVGAVHVVCNNAGIAHTSSILASSAADWRRVVDVNLLGVVHGILAFAPTLVAQGEGHVLNTASMAGFVAGNGLASYDASKHAVVALTENLWRELHGTGVGVSLLVPAYVDTPLFANATGDDAARRTFATTTARWGADAMQVAEVAVDAVKADRFWVFTHPDTVGMTTIKGEYAVAGEPPADPFRSPRSVTSPAVAPQALASAVDQSSEEPARDRS
jgi:NAD(P)-dependent dehydrogenase (short-subunit alcohol dehydrogenase family)